MPPNTSSQIIGRIQEQQILKKLLCSKEAEFLALYGRRRVGKTFLIKRFFKTESCLFFSVTGQKKAPIKEQLATFTRKLETVFYDNRYTLQDPASWMDALRILQQALTEQAQYQKIILFFDELPWLASRKSRFLEALDYYWNTEWVDDSRIKLIVCGSAASWMIKKIVHDKGGLHNRLTATIRLAPFNLLESQSFLASKHIQLNNKAISDIYMVTGGVPYYLQQIERGLSPAQNIDKLCFSKQGLLFEEFNKVFSSLFNHADIHIALIRLISHTTAGISRKELIKKAKTSSGGQLNEKLKELEEVGFITRFTPYFHKKRGVHYRTSDEYSLFYLYWIEPVIESVKHKNKEVSYWASKISSGAFKAWAGYAFEALCYKHIDQIMKKLHIPPGSEIGSWRYIPSSEEASQGAQIDLLFDRDDGIITLCEIKYTEKPFVINKEYAKQLISKIEAYQKYATSAKQISFAMISANGLKETMYSEELVDHLVTLEDLFKP